MVISVCIYAGVVIKDTNDLIAEMQNDLNTATEMYNEATANFNEDEMYILEHYDAYLAGCAYGYRTGLEEQGYIVIDERIGTVSHGVYTLMLETLTGEM